jgi:biotin synthase
MDKMKKYKSLIESVGVRISKGTFVGLSETEAFTLSKVPVLFYTAVFDLAARINKYVRSKPDKCGSFYSDISPCAEDCAFCPFSHQHYAPLNLEQQTTESLIESMIKYADGIVSLGISHFKIVSTGLRADDGHIEKISEGVALIKKKHPDLHICISMGLLSRRNLEKLKQAGADCYNNNLETSKEFFDYIVSTHSFEKKVKAIKLAQEIGFKICSGGIFGVGETIEDRIKLFFILKELKVDSSPFNIFVKYDHIPLSERAGKKSISSLEIFLSLALFRLIYPENRIVLGGGRDFYLSEEEQEFALFVGASALQSSNALNGNGIIERISKDDLLFNRITD